HGAAAQRGLGAVAQHVRAAPVERDAERLVGGDLEAERADGRREQAGGQRPLHRSRRAASARASVAWSAYSRSPPMGMPCASRVTLMPMGLSSFTRYSAVASPS